ncbi:MAG: AEC family transporter [Rhodanobacteraceae bacterium]|nr:AEC family transporter [Rhodanobacteraceae bacterium]MBP9154325.1 AEC family transporter [Xanthomonadales bacterium]HQW81331.1 AEC family transporter [Pseudomonadota bacterium]
MNFDALLFVLLMLALGYLCARTRVLPDNAAEVLNQFVLVLCLPAAILHHVPKLRFGADIVGVALVPWLVLGLSIAAIVPIARWLRLRNDERAVLLLCVPLGNTSFLGYPLTEALLGRDALPYAVIYDQFGSFLILTTWGLWVLARYAGDARPTPAIVLRKALRFPPLLALILALTVMPAAPPEWAAKVLLKLADTLLPIAVLAVGLSLNLRLPRDELRPLSVGLLLKLIVLPGCVLALMALTHNDGVAADALVLETAMPPMITASALAISHRLAPGLAAALVGYGSVLALITLPFWTWCMT